MHSRMSVSLRTTTLYIGLGMLMWNTVDLVKGVFSDLTTFVQNVLWYQRDYSQYLWEISTYNVNITGQENV